MTALEKVRDEDPAAPPAAPESPPEYVPIEDSPIRVLRLFQEMNEVFRRVERIMEARGVSHVSQLDHDSRIIVIICLESALERIEARP